MDKKDLTIRTLLFSPYSLFVSVFSDGMVIGVSSLFCLKSGYSENLFMGKPLADLDLWPSPGDAHGFWNLLTENNGVEAWATELSYADGVRIPYVLSANLYNHDGEIWVLVSGRENSEHKEIEHALKHSESLYREAQEIAHIGHWELDLKSQHLTWSEEIFRIFDMEPYLFSASYEAFLDLIHPDDREMVDKAYRSSVENDERYEVIHRLKMKDGRIKHVHEKGRTERDVNKEPVRSIGTVQDITALRESEQARERIERQLRQSQKMEAIGTLAGGIAHDFNNILFAILGFTEMCMEMTDKDMAQYKHLERIFEAGNRAKDLVNQILTFSRQNVEQKKNVLIRLVVKEALKLIKATLPSSIHITEHLDSSARISADSTQIHQVVMNLCSNSAHAMQSMDSGHLTVELSELEVDTEFARRYLGMVPGRYVKLLVSDTGHGMIPEIRERIFEPYFTTKGEGEGTGLGLSVVHGIVKAHDGQIMVYSEPGKGTTIKIFFPVIEEPHDELKTAMETPRRGDERILLVDDEKVLADLMKSMLTSLGYRVTAFSNSLSALETFKASPDDFDLLITDMTMPDMNGLKLAENILSMRIAMKVILSTGFSERISDTMIEAAGIKAMIFKPIVKKELAEVVRNVLDATEQ
jgi:PAS domain S-box-containing protein